MIPMNSRGRSNEAHALVRRGHCIRSGQRKGKQKRAIKDARHRHDDTRSVPWRGYKASETLGVKPNPSTLNPDPSSLNGSFLSCWRRALHIIYTHTHTLTHSHTTHSHTTTSTHTTHQPKNLPLQTARQLTPLTSSHSPPSTLMHMLRGCMLFSLGQMMHVDFRS